MSQAFCCHCVEYIKTDICAKFHDHRSNNNKVMMGACPITDGSKKAHVKTLIFHFAYFVEHIVGKSPKSFSVLGCLDQILQGR